MNADQDEEALKASSCCSSRWGNGSTLIKALRSGEPAERRNTRWGELWRVVFIRIVFLKNGMTMQVRDRHGQGWAIHFHPTAIFYPRSRKSESSGSGRRKANSTCSSSLRTRTTTTRYSSTEKPYTPIGQNCFVLSIKAQPRFRVSRLPCGFPRRWQSRRLCRPAPQWPPPRLPRLPARRQTCSRLPPSR